MKSMLKLLVTNDVFFILLVFFAGLSCAEEGEYLLFSESAMQDPLEITEPELLLRQRRSVTSSVNDTLESSSRETTDEPETFTNATELETPMSGSARVESTTEATTMGLTTTTPQPTTSVFNTTTIRDNHQYYVSHVYNKAEITTPYLEVFKKKFIGVKPSHSFLRKAIGRVKLFKSSFDFLFYGHSMRDIAITTGGFLYMSDFLHPHITHSQYVAPLMGQFHTKENSSDIYHVDDGSAFWVLWKNLYLNGKESDGPFTFYTVIHQNGTIVVGYEKLSILPKDIPGTRKIGLSDAFYQDVLFTFGIRIRRIFRYHLLEIDPASIRDGTVVVIDPLLTCHQLKTCTDCLSGRSSFKCSWCRAVGRCSSGIDRQRQEWLQKSCHLQSDASSDCSTSSSSTTAKIVGVTEPSRIASGATDTTSKSRRIGFTSEIISDGVSTRPPASFGRRQQPKGLNSPMTVGLVFLIIVLVAGVVGLTMWCRYAYVHPASPSGIWLMEHRPSVIKQKMTSIFRTGSNNPGERYQVSFNAQESVA